MEYQEEEKRQAEEQYNNPQTEEETVLDAGNNQVAETCQESKTTSNSNKTNILTIGLGILTVAVIVLFILHFSQPKSNKTVPVNTNAESKTLIVTINTDSIMEHFELMKLLKEDLEKETEKYHKELQKKSSEFEDKYRNYMINVQNNVLTQTQMQNAERQLLQEKESLEALSERYTKILVDKEMSVQNEIMDSLKNASRRVNEAGYKADYVFAISAGSAIIHANNYFDITDEVIRELNESYRKSTK